MAKNREEIIKNIKDMSDEKYMNFHSGLCPGTNNIMGVRTPILRKYAKELSDDDWEKNYNLLSNEFYEEVMLKGMMIGYAKFDIDKILNYLENFIPQIDNWAICDITSAGLKFTKNNKELMWNFIKKYLDSENEFECRFAIVILLSYYIDDEYVDKVIKILDSEGEKTYYIKMAVAWAVSTVYIKYPQKGLEYMKNSKLDDSTYNISIQKIVDSYRVNDKEKDNLRKMRRK